MKKILLIITILFSITFIAFADNVNGPDTTLKTTVTSVDAGKLVKVSITFSEPVMRFARDQVSVDGGSVESVRKLSATSYILFARASADSKELDIQVEAGKVQNTSKIFNEYASNELTIAVNAPTPIVPPATNNTSEISSLLDTVVKATAAQQAQVQQQQAAPQVTYYNCNGNSIPTTQQCVQQTQQVYNAYGNYYYTNPAATTYNPGYYNSYYNSVPAYYPTSYYDNGYSYGYGYGTGYNYNTSYSLRNLFDW